ncbi:hypothetical protein [Pseudogemmobacter bohemicus]|uniref:hypothetical protein n=1 Tax=Pseudogemmobacter bohemicus TaxID=2250708 RepID=UPI0013006DBB|nr:hypothetical protein [Pseudogemmobacter bohemicus]
MSEVPAHHIAAFDGLFTDFGLPPILPERLIRAGLIQIPGSAHPERPLIGQRQ